MSLRAAQGLWRRAPEPLRRLAAPLIRQGLDAYVRTTTAPSTRSDRPGLPVKVVGYFSSSHGIGASARLALRAFQALGVAAEAVDVGGDGSLNLGVRLREATPAAAWIFHLNPPEMIAALAQLGPNRMVGPRYGYWAWELPRAPARWLKDARLVDEVWAPSRYTADAFAGAAAPCRVVPHPLFLEDYKDVVPAPREHAFEAVAMFDFNSSVARKNPQGAVAAFARAFGDAPDVRLTLKTQGGQQAPELLAKLRSEAGPNVRILDEVWSYAEVKRLIASADVLISLHRAEGFGLPMAEAMALGTPVLATDFSGNRDFMDPQTGLLVPAALTPVIDPQGIYRGQSWAEPDIDAAAESLRRLRSDDGLRARLAKGGRRRVEQLLSPSAWFATLPPSLREAVGRD